jgi:hypothetical protein
LRLRKSLKNCSNGDPGGNIGISGPAPGPPARACIAWVDEMFTTAGNSFAARSAKLSGDDLAKADVDGTPAASGTASATARATAAADGQRIRRMGENSLADWPDMARRPAAGN